VIRLRTLPSNGRFHANATAQKLKNLRFKTSRVAEILESELGKPVQAVRLARPLDMLIATILSQNTNDKNSHRAYAQLRKKYGRWQNVAKAPLRGIISAIRAGGMANQKSLRIKETLLAVKDRFGGYDLSPLKKRDNEEVINELTKFNGVGVKTASCVLLFSMGRDVFPVDTHVHRVCGRLGLAPGCATPEKTFQFMKTLVPKRKGYSFHTNLIRFGRRVCRSINPACGVCPLYDECLFPGKERALRVNRAASNADHDFMLLDNIQVAH
jgi:endonuclease-3